MVGNGFEDELPRLARGGRGEVELGGDDRRRGEGRTVAQHEDRRDINKPGEGNTRSGLGVGFMHLALGYQLDGGAGSRKANLLGPKALR